jgi:hypothetical protein
MKLSNKVVYLVLMFTFILFSLNSITVAAIQPYAIIQPTKWVYTKSSETKSYVKTFQHTHTNTSSGTDSVTYSVAISQYSEGTVSTQVEFNAIVAKATVGAQVSYGVSTTKTLSITWSIPPYTTRTLEAGHRFVKTTGTMRSYDSYGQLFDTYAANGNWTYGTYSN